MLLKNQRTALEKLQQISIKYLLIINKILYVHLKQGDEIKHVNT